MAFNQQGNYESFVNRLQAAGLPDNGYFHVRDSEMTPERSSKIKVIADSESLEPSSY